MVCPSAPLKTVLFAPNPFGPRQNASTVEQVEARKESRSTAQFRKPVSFASLLAVQRREGLSAGPFSTCSACNAGLYPPSLRQEPEDDLCAQPQCRSYEISEGPQRHALPCWHVSSPWTPHPCTDFQETLDKIRQEIDSYLGSPSRLFGAPPYLHWLRSSPL